MSSKHCLNCGSHLVGEYCHKCGQSASTHRLSLKHFVAHDMVHGILHLDKGILYTLRELFLRPGKFVHEYIGGKRAGHFSVVPLLVILAGILFFIAGSDASKVSPINISLGEQSTADPNLRERILFISQHHKKWILLGFVPVFTIASRWFFSRRKYYYTEHLVINGYLMAVFIVIVIFFKLLFKLAFLAPYDNSIVRVGVAALFLFYGYWSVWKDDYSFPGWLWRLFLSLLVSSILVLVLIAVVAVLISVFFDK